jgi:hypothetical protein
VGKILLFYALNAFLRILLFCFPEKSGFFACFTPKAREKARLLKCGFLTRFPPETGLYTALFYAFFCGFQRAVFDAREGKPKRGTVQPRRKRGL